MTVGSRHHAGTRCAAATGCRWPLAACGSIVPCRAVWWPTRRRLVGARQGRPPAPVASRPRPGSRPAAFVSGAPEMSRAGRRCRTADARGRRRGPRQQRIYYHSGLGIGGAGAWSRGGHVPGLIVSSGAITGHENAPVAPRRRRAVRDDRELVSLQPYAAHGAMTPGAGSRWDRRLACSARKAPAAVVTWRDQVVSRREVGVRGRLRVSLAGLRPRVRPPAVPSRVRINWRRSATSLLDGCVRGHDGRPLMRLVLSVARPTSRGARLSQIRSARHLRRSSRWRPEASSRPTILPWSGGGPPRPAALPSIQARAHAKHQGGLGDVQDTVVSHDRGRRAWNLTPVRRSR